VAFIVLNCKGLVPAASGKAPEMRGIRVILNFKGAVPRIGRDVFIAPTAVVIGDVTIGDRASIWYGAVLRGDLAPIRIGCGSNIQDGCTIHTDLEYPTVVGDHVVVGHQAVLHGCTVEDLSLIGIRAVVLNGARIGSGAVVAAGAVVLEGAVVGPLQLVAGAPAVVRKELPESRRDKTRRSAENYMRLAEDHRRALAAGGPHPGVGTFT
jgi:carbonic anhydrase/acetyltransferase-like protein (isoleucine patch superfamily)